MSEEEEILKQTVIEEDKPKSSLAEKLQEQKDAQKKKNKKRIMILGGVGLLSFLVWFLMKPYKASYDYGICRTFLELNIPYPHTIYVSELKYLRDGSLKLWYTHTDAFGEYRIESFVCKLATDPETGIMEVASLKMHKTYLDPEKVKGYNSALAYFAANPLILTWPAPLPDSLNDLHFDFNAVRRIIIDPKQ